jgi:predicted ABC-type sugar transport system permease subunit
VTRYLAGLVLMILAGTIGGTLVGALVAACLGYDLW